MDHKNSLPLGTRLTTPAGVYTIQKVLGAGGFGITYLAVLPTRFNNIKAEIHVAIKEHFPADDCTRDLTSSQLTYSSTAQQRVELSKSDFLEEAQCLQRLAGLHPNIVPVNEVFTANNTAYYVMEYLKGETLKQYVSSRGRLSVKETLSVMMPIVEAVATLHSNKFTHLDLKPSNIMLATEEGNPEIRPVLIDFGLARHYNADGSATATLKSSGFSDGYAPVEQYSGISTFSPWVDVYALGATILFCLTGKTPPRSVDLNDSRLAAVIPPDVPERLRRLLMYSMAFQATDRLPNARQMYLDLENICRTEGIDCSKAMTTASGEPVDDRTRITPDRQQPVTDPDDTHIASAYRQPTSNPYMGPVSNPYQQSQPDPRQQPRSNPYQQQNYGESGGGSAGISIGTQIQETKPSTPIWIWITIGLLVVALAVAAVLLTKKYSGSNNNGPYLADSVEIPEDTAFAPTIPANYIPGDPSAEAETAPTYVEPGQRTPDLGFHDLSGPVRQIKNQWGATVPFSESGSWTGTWHDQLGERKFIRDSSGRIVTEYYSTSENGPGEKNYTWSGNHVTSSEDENLGESVFYEYDSDGEMSTMTIYKNGKTTKYVFSNPKYDRYGNWTSRSYTRYTDDGYNSSTSSGTQKRYISYYN